MRHFDRIRARHIVPAVLAVLLFATTACGSEPTNTADDQNQSAAKAEAGKDDMADDDGNAGKDDMAGEEGSADKDDMADKDDSAAEATVPAKLKFTSTTLDGAKFDGSMLAGKPTALWFWAPWCPHCQAEAADAKQLAQAFEGKVNVVGVAGKAEQQDMTDFVTQNGLDGFTHLADDNDPVWQRFGVAEQSTWVLLDENGNEVHSGPLKEPDLTKQVEALAS